MGGQSQRASPYTDFAVEWPHVGILGGKMAKTKSQDGERMTVLQGVMKAMEFVMDWTLRIIGPVLICVATSLICSVVYIFFTTVVYFVATPWSFWYGFHTVCTLWFAGNILFNYYSCVLTSPGFAPRESDL